MVQALWMSLVTEVPFETMKSLVYQETVVPCQWEVKHETSFINLKFIVKINEADVSNHPIVLAL